MEALHPDVKDVLLGEDEIRDIVARMGAEISQDYAAQAKAVADALDARLAGQPFPQRTVIPYRLILRDSVRPAR